MKIAPYLLEFGDSQGEAAGLAGNSEIALRTPT